MNPPASSRPARQRGVAFLCLLLAGCGGGGGSVATGPPPTSPMPPPVDTAGTTPPPEPPAVPCTTVHDGRCLTTAEFLAERDAMAQASVERGEYEMQYVLEVPRVPEAHAALDLLHGPQVRYGAGSRVAFLDIGLDTNHVAFTGVDVERRTPAQFEDDPQHGTGIASVIGGARRIYTERRYHCAPPDCAMSVETRHTFTVPQHMGTAPGADIDFYLQSDFYRVPDLTMPTSVRRAVADGAHFISISVGGGDMVTNYAAGEFPKNTPNRINQSLVDAIAQRGAENPAVVTWAAGNEQSQPCTPEAGDRFGSNRQNCLTRPEFEKAYGERCANPDMSEQYCVYAPEPRYGAGMALHYPELRDRLVAVVAVHSPSGDIAHYSNLCGAAADWCIAAPDYHRTALHEIIDDAGNRVKTTTELGRGRGTSFAAPQVAAGLALMRQYFRGQMSNPDLLARLYATANKTGQWANREIYGQGLMDLGTALSPLGTSTVSTGTADAALHRTRLALGSAFGDGMARSLAGQELVALDALGAPFWHDASMLVQGAARPSGAQRLAALWDAELDAPAPSARRALAAFASPWSFGLHAPVLPARASLLNVAGAASSVTYAPGRWSLAAYTTAGRAGQRERPEHGALLAFRPQRGLGLRLGLLRETHGLLGSDSRGAFGRVSAHSAALGFEWSGRALGWGLAADVELGVVDGRAAGGLLEGMSGLATSTAQLRAHRRLSGRDDMLLSLSQPLRLERGRARLRLPVARGLDGAVAERELTARLAPSGRQLDLAAYWQRREVLGGALRAGAVVSRHPGHAAGAFEAGVQLGFRRAF